MLYKGEKGLHVNDESSEIFKLDAKLVLIYDNEEYPVASCEFAPYAGPQKIKSDRSKLLLEGNILINKMAGLNIDQSNMGKLNIVNLQIMGKAWVFSFPFDYKPKYLTC
jgi:hypothetical protein